MPRIIPKPPVKPEKTGIPIAPRRTKTKTDIVPSFPPKSPIVRKTPKVCKVNGTDVGIEIQEHTVIIATKIAHKHNCLTDILDVVNLNTSFQFTIIAYKALFVNCI